MVEHGHTVENQLEQDDRYHRWPENHDRGEFDERREDDLDGVEAHRDGKHIRYQLSDDRTLDAIRDLRILAEAHLDQVGDLVSSYLRSRDALEPVPASELLERARDGLVTVVDVRPPEEYAQAHIPGALNIPLDKLKQRLKQLPRDREVVAYCRGPWCVLSYEAVARLRKAGIEARRLEDGLPEWRRAGLPVDRS